MKENSDLSNLFPTLTIAKDLEEIWQYLCDGKYLVGADLTLYRRTPFVMENAFFLSFVVVIEISLPKCLLKSLQC